jgi:hypothetical protein
MIAMYMVGDIWSGLVTLGVLGSLPVLLRITRRRPVLHLRLFAAGARFGKVFFPANVMLMVGSGYLWNHTNPYLAHHQWQAAMWTYAASGLCLLYMQKLRVFRFGNAAITWCDAQEAGMHITVRRVSAKEARSFVDTATSLWLKACSLGFTRVRMWSPLLGDEARCRRFAEKMRDQSISQGVPCEIEYLKPKTWNWFMSLWYFIQHERKSKCPHKRAQRWYQRAFRVPVGGFRLILLEQPHM